MAAYQEFNCFIEDIAHGKHNLSSDQLVIALTNTAPVATNTVLANIAQIAYTNLSSRNVTTTSSGQTNGNYALVLQDLILTASGAVPTFRYAVLYNDTALNDPLIAFWDYGTAGVTMQDTETITIDMPATLLSGTSG